MLRHVNISCCYEGCFAVITLHPQEDARLRNSHEWFYCPAGHRQHYSGETAAEKKLKEALSTAEREGRWGREWLERYDVLTHAVDMLARGSRTCPLGCGWSTNRRFRFHGSPHIEEIELEVSRFLDRCGQDLVDHLVADHNSSRSVRGKQEATNG